MVYIGDSRARNPNRSWWNKPEINNMTEAMTSVGCRDQGKRWHDWCPGRPGLSSRRWSLREDATTGCKNELPCFLSFSHLLLCPQPPHVRPSRCQLTREPRKRGKAKKKKKRHWKANESNRPRFNPWVGTISWRREWLPTPVLLPGEFHGQMSLVDVHYGKFGKQNNNLYFHNAF